MDISQMTAYSVRIIIREVNLDVLEELVKLRKVNMSIRIITLIQTRLTIFQRSLVTALYVLASSSLFISCLITLTGMNVTITPH